MRVLLRRPVPTGGEAQVAVTDASDGDLAIAAPDVVQRRRGLVDLPWMWMNQVHGARVLRVDRDAPPLGAEADAAVTIDAGIALAVQTADCAPIGLVADDGALGVVHAGWKGLAAGVVPAAVAALRSASGSDRVVAVLGPCIGPDVYEFGADELDRVAGTVGDVVRARTADGRPALDLGAGVRAELARCDVEVVTADERTTNSPELFSHRCRRDTGRQAMVVWRAP